MPKFRMSDIATIEKASTSPAVLRNKLSDMIMSSVSARAEIELVNHDTGEYRVVLQGTLDREESDFDETR